VSWLVLLFIKCICGHFHVVSLGASALLVLELYQEESLWPWLWLVL